MKKKNKKKISGNEKTLKKTEKKLNSKHKKELAVLNEEDIETVIAQIEKEEASRQKVVEAVVSPPSRRVNFTLTPHPFKDELIMLGGEFCNGQKTVVYGDLFFYNINKNEWTVVKAPYAPPPRCSHQAIGTQSNNGEIWIFGGEFSSPSESQFYHYRDLWKFHIGEKKWEKILAPGGPSARSGHRMINIKKNLYVFGGFYDNHKDCKYFNDIYCFNMTNYVWNRIETSGIPPVPRSGCIVLPTPENKILIYGGYIKEKIKKDVYKGHIHSDMFLLTPEKNDETGLKWKWSTVKPSGITVSPRCSASAVIVQPNIAYIFGGVFDEEDNEEELNGRLFNDLFSLNLSKPQWHRVHLSGKTDLAVRKKRRTIKDNENEENIEENEIEDNTEDVETEIESALARTVVTDDDGIFTVTLGPTLSTNKVTSDVGVPVSDTFTPAARINASLAVKNNILYMYGGMIEDGDKQYTLNDFYSLDCKKLDKWTTIINDDISTLVLLDSSSSESESDEDIDEDNNEMEDA
ncbi:PREDICTED: kelch domain-containing protein 4 [Ceratosolen solmsi marchali]|uniref:Kelch domain-containing protein 4 n=1 Tax=Ceratosolen solmsi marchali TaxID=326594 RepID=A0AAJ7DX53_9HYME|nr:PREDICTED: kelch domain-containing protein 4 [Ceratosolen solmsi marchali]